MLPIFQIVMVYLRSVILVTTRIQLTLFIIATTVIFKGSNKVVSIMHFKIQYEQCCPLW